MKSFFKWLVAPRENRESWLHVIGWWELRRIPYNLIVGVLGIVSLALFFLFIHLADELQPGEDAVEPLVIIYFAPIAINILYTGGWMGELLLRIVWREKSPHIGPILFKLGISLSVFVIFLPSAVWLVYEKKEQR
jgi:hypothetical protein